MPQTVVERFRRLLDAGNRRVDFARPGARVLLVLLALAAVGALAAAVRLAYLDTRATATLDDPRPAYVNRVREKLQLATDIASQERLRPGQTGSLRLRIEVNPDGQLIAASVVQSSGDRVLDDAALQIVRESAPFEPFPPPMRGRTTSVEINSTFHFSPFETGESRRGLP
jgi:TonB family protein